MQKEEKEVKELELAVYTDLHIDVLVKKLQERHSTLSKYTRVFYYICCHTKYKLSKNIRNLLNFQLTH